MNKTTNTNVKSKGREASTHNYFKLLFLTFGLNFFTLFLVASFDFGFANIALTTCSMVKGLGVVTEVGVLP